VNKMKKTFYKLARPDGFDFYTGKTINYRENIGKDVRPPNKGKVRLCSDTCLHASKNPNAAFVGARIPCSVFRVEGKPIVEDEQKAGFNLLHVVEELDPEKIFEWRYAEANNPLNPFPVSPPKITDGHIQLLKRWDSVWASVWDSVGASVRASVWDSVWDSVRASVRASVGASVWDSVGASVWDSVGASVWDSVGASVRASVRASVWDSVEASVGASVEASVGDSVEASVWASVEASVWASVEASVEAYIGYIFAPAVPKWKTEYPYQSAVDLWMQGLVPSYDGNVWRLHGGINAEILWEGTIKRIRD